MPIQQVDLVGAGPGNMQRDGDRAFAFMSVSVFQAELSSTTFKLPGAINDQLRPVGWDYLNSLIQRPKPIGLGTNSVAAGSW